jgi:hypothetical protein
VVAESVLVRHQLLILNRGRQRAPNLRVADRFIAGVCTLFICRARLLRSAIVLRPSTLLHLHRFRERVSREESSASQNALSPGRFEVSEWRAIRPERVNQVLSR